MRGALERGLAYNFHQDTPVLEPDMLQTVWCAANRVTRGGQPIGQDQCVSVYDALKGVTCSAAYAYHEEDRKGTLEEGKLADLVILDHNPLKTDIKEKSGTFRCWRRSRKGRACTGGNKDSAGHTARCEDG